MKLIFIKGIQEAQQLFPLMGFAIFHALGEAQNSGSIFRVTLSYTFLSRCS